MQSPGDAGSETSIICLFVINKIIIFNTKFIVFNAEFSVVSPEHRRPRAP